MKNYIKKIEQQVKERMSKPVKKEKVSDKKGFMIPKEVGKKEKELPADDMDLIVDASVVVTGRNGSYGYERPNTTTAVNFGTVNDNLDARDVVGNIYIACMRG